MCIAYLQLCLSVQEEVGAVNLGSILVGSGILILLAALVGAIDGQARRSAWQVIAERRRANWEERERLSAVLSSLSQKAGVCQCQLCQMVRQMDQPG
jgi:hypothetical protein